MDLLGELNDGPVRAKIYRKNLEVEEKSDNELSSDNEQDQNYSQLVGHNENKSNTGANVNMTQPDFSILEKIKRRLNGEPEPSEEISASQKPTQNDHESQKAEKIWSTASFTQKISEELQTEASQIIPDFSTSSLFTTHGIEQNETSSSPQASTQVITTLTPVETMNNEPENDNSIGTDFVSQKTNEDDEEADSEETEEYTEKMKDLTPEERSKRLEALVAAKREQRSKIEENKAKEANQLEADISRVTLTDEENDDMDVSMTMGTTAPKNRKSSKKLEKEMEQQTARLIREQVFVPKAKQTVVFSKDAFLSEFMKPSSAETTSFDTAPITMITPNTSPMKPEAVEFVDKTDGKEKTQVKERIKEIDDLKDSFPYNPLLSYQQKLKSHSDLAVELDSESDSELKTKESKVIRLEVKAKFQKKKSKDGMDLSMANKAAFLKKRFLHKLHSANKGQLIQNKKELMRDIDVQELKDIETKEQQLESLLEREIERVNKIKQKERDLAKNEKHGETEDENEEVPDSDYDFESAVDESDYSEEGDDEADDESSDNESGAESDDINESRPPAFQLKARKSKTKIILSDDEEETITSTELVEKSSQEEFKPAGNLIASLNKESFNLDSYGMGDNTQTLKNVFGLNLFSQEMEDSQPITKQTTTTNVFDRLRNDNNVVLGEEDDSHFDTQQEASFDLYQSKPKEKFDTALFNTLSTQSQVIEGPKFIAMASKIAESSENPDETQTQVDGNSQSQTIYTYREENLSNSKKGELHEQSENEKGSKTHTQGKKKLVNKEISDSESEDEETLQLKLKIFKERQRKEELKQRKKRRDFERKGVKKVVDGEAVESEDEWQGIGGIDGELSDQANSEDERMIDDNFKIDFNEEEIRKKIISEHMIEDKEELERLVDDIKNHKLIKRRQIINGYDLDSSDGEDYILQAFHQQKAAKQREKLLANKQMQELSRDTKKKAFFATIEETSVVYKLDDEEDENIQTTQADLSEDKGDNTDEDNPFFESKEKANKDKEEPGKVPVLTRKKVAKITEAYVQQALSFLEEVDKDDEFERAATLAKHQHGFVSSDEEDMHTLKRKSSIKMSSSKEKIDLTEGKKRNASIADLDADIDLMSSFKKPSLTRSYKSFVESKNSLVKDGIKSVTVNKSYKIANGSKASITSFTSRNSSTKELKVERMTKTLKRSRGDRKQIFNGGKFDS